MCVEYVFGPHPMSRCGFLAISIEQPINWPRAPEQLWTFMTIIAALLQTLRS